MSDLLIFLKFMICALLHQAVLNLFVIDDENIRIRLFLYDNRINM